jgi:hypothetical protein
MNPVRTILTAGVALLTASALLIAPSVQPPPPPKPTPTIQLAADIHLAVDVQPLLDPQEPLLPILFSSPLRLLGPAAPFGTLPPAPAPLSIAIAPNLANTIDSVYIAVEPWVRYGFEVATAVVRWIPWVGWFAGQIMVFYNFFEGMIASGVFNFTDWLRGDGGAVENLVDFGIDVGLAFVWLGLDEVAQFIPLPPFCCYPPRPPVQGPFSTSQTLAGPTEATSTVEPNGKGALKKLQVDATVDVAATDTEKATGEGTVKGRAEEAKEPKGPKTTTSSSTDVSAQGEVRGAPKKDMESVKVSNGEKKGQKGDTGATAESATGSSESATANDDTGTKRDNKADKKDDTGKKE